MFTYLFGSMAFLVKPILFILLFKVLSIAIPKLLDSWRNL